MMLPSATHLPGSYDPLGVILSIVTAVAASYTALDSAGCVAARKGWTFATWLVGPSLWALAPCPCTPPCQHLLDSFSTLN
jgi:NO-binding membrane sensor protein with MHYT domain